MKATFNTGTRNDRPTILESHQNIMTDLTLDEYKGVSEEAIKKALKEEAEKMFGSDFLESKDQRPKDQLLLRKPSHTSCLQSARQFLKTLFSRSVIVHPKKFFDKI